MNPIKLALKTALDKFVRTVPPRYQVQISFSNHFFERLLERSDRNPASSIFDIIECIQYNYPLILFYSKLDTSLPERGRLESNKFVICGDIINDRFVLRTFYKKE